MFVQRLLSSIPLVVVALGVAASLFPPSVVAQDPMARVRSLYEQADYEEALQVLATLKSPAANTEAASYRMFCLFALGRNAEARAAVEAIVRADPMFQPAPAQVSPRIRTFFDEVRRPLLGDVARESYGKAKAAFDQKNWSLARDEFSRVVAVLAEMKTSDAGLMDLKTVAAGFRDLAASALNAEAKALDVSMKPALPPSPSPSPSPSASPSASPPPTSAPPATPEVYGDSDADVTKPTSVVRTLPAWRPLPSELKATFSGTLELVLDEQGKVLSTVLVKSVHPRYDASLLEASKQWTFQPATRNGRPVRYRYLVAINLTGPVK